MTEERLAEIEAQVLEIRDAMCLQIHDALLGELVREVRRLNDELRVTKGWMEQYRRRVEGWNDRW